MERIILTENQKAIVTRLGNGTYTPEYLEEWLNRADNVYINAPAALQAMGASGFYKAVLAMERAEQGKKAAAPQQQEAAPAAGNTPAAAAGKSTAAPATTPKKRGTKKTEVKANEQDKKPGSNA